MEKLYTQIMLFVSGGAGYCALELYFRRESHWTMLFAGGFSLLIIYYIARLQKTPRIIKWLLCGLSITALELVCGLLVNRLFSLGVWCYDRLPLNFMGQICLQYSLLWCIICIPVVRIFETDKEARYGGGNRKNFEKGQRLSGILYDLSDGLITKNGKNAQIAVIASSFGALPQETFPAFLLPEGLGKNTHGLNVTYGMSALSDFTLSSVGDKICLLSLSRQLSLPWGIELEPQEIAVKRMGLSPYELLTAAAALLLVKGSADDFSVIT